MDKIKQIESELAKSSDIIKTPYQYIYDMLDFDITNEDLCNGLRLVLEHNKAVLKQVEENIKDLAKIIKDSKKESKEENTGVTEQPVYNVQSKYISDNNKNHLSSFIYFEDIDEIDEFFNTNPQAKEKISEIKFYLYGEILKIKKELKEKLVLDYSADLKDLQEKIIKYEYFLEYLNEQEQEKEEIIEEENLKYNIILVPNGKNGSYLNDDILEYLNNNKEIKIAVDKILSGYFMESKHTRPLINYNRLYEYKNSKNGIRILFIVMGDNNIAISSLFYKDKQKSIKIENYYQEAINRYKKFENYILDNLNNPDFNIEQLELIGQIRDNLESDISLNFIKKGDA